jgi:hypothetical protein
MTWVERQEEAPLRGEGTRDPRAGRYLVYPATSKSQLINSASISPAFQRSTLSRFLKTSGARMRVVGDGSRRRCFRRCKSLGSLTELVASHFSVCNTIHAISCISPYQHQQAEQSRNGAPLEPFRYSQALSCLLLLFSAVARVKHDGVVGSRLSLPTSPLHTMARQSLWLADKGHALARCSSFFYLGHRPPPADDVS